MTIAFELLIERWKDRARFDGIGLGKVAAGVVVAARMKGGALIEMEKVCPHILHM